MPRISLPQLEVVYRETFVMQPLYRMTRQWLMENDYVDEKDDVNLEQAMEILYWYRKGTPMDPNEGELRIWWRTKKRGVPVATSGSRFYTFRIEIDWNVIQMSNREVMRDGKKEKVEHGELRILIKPYIDVLDVKGIPIIGWFDSWVRTRLIRKNLDENRKILYQDAYRLQGTIKKYLELQSFLPAEDVFHEKFEFI